MITIKEGCCEVNEVLGFTDTLVHIRDEQTVDSGGKRGRYAVSNFKSEVKRREVKPWCKRRIQGKMKQLRQDIRRLEMVASGDTTRHESIEKLRKRYNIKKKESRFVTEELSKE